MLILVLFVLLSIAGAIASIAALRTDGYRRIPTRSAFDTRVPAP